MAIKSGGWLLFILIVAAVLFVGWREPLRYRFLSRAEIQEIEHPPPPPTPPPAPATPRPGAWMNDPAHKSPLAPGAGGIR